MNTVASAAERQAVRNMLAMATQVKRVNDKAKSWTLPSAIKRIDELEALVAELKAQIKASGIDLPGKVDSLKDAGWLTAKQYAASIGVSVSQVTRNWGWLRGQGAIQEGNGYMHIPASLAGCKYPRKTRKSRS